MSLDQILLWALTLMNTFLILLLVRQLASLPQYRRSKGPSVGAAFDGWSLPALGGGVRTSAQMPSEYTLLFASATCAPCHTLLEKLAVSGRTRGTLVIATDGNPEKVREAATGPQGPLYDDFLIDADHTFRERIDVPGTPFAVAIRNERVVSSGPASTPEALQKVADSLRSATVVAAAQP